LGHLESRVFNKNGPIKSHIHSSLWSSIKVEVNCILGNSSWNLGNGNQINFWRDNWCGEPITSSLNLPTFLASNLTAKVCDFIRNYKWYFPLVVQQLFPAITVIAQKVTIPKVDLEDKLLWTPSHSGQLSFKESHLFKTHGGQQLNWAKVIWSPDIPPSKSMLAWRLMQDKIPTNDKLKHRGFIMASICSLCSTSDESSSHLFFSCPFALKIWAWLASILNISLHVNSAEDILSICNRNFTPQCKMVIKASIINIIHSIWYTRNQARFMNKKIHWKSAINTIISIVSLAGNNTKLCSSVNMQEFVILKAFKVNIHPPEAPIIKEVIWTPPLPPTFNWLMVNTDGAVVKNPTRASCGGIFRNAKGVCRGCFAQNIPNCASAFTAELFAVIIAIEIAENKLWKDIWLETDSQSVVLAFKNISMVPWSLRN